MDNIEATNMLLTVNDDSSPPHVTSAGDHNDVTGIEFDEIGDFVLLDIKLDGVVNPDGRVWVADSPAVVRNNIWNALRTNGHFPNLEKLVASLLGCNAVDGETTLNIVKKTEVFARFFNGNDI